MTTMTLTGACDTLAYRNSLHARIGMVLRNQGRDKAEKLLLERIHGDIEDALFHSTERDDPCALAARFLNTQLGFRMMIELNSAVKRALSDLEG